MIWMCCGLLPGGEGMKFLRSGCELFCGEGFYATGGEGFAGEGGEDGAVDDGATEHWRVVGRVTLGGEVSCNAAEEGIASAGGIGDGFEGIGGTAEDVCG